ncbi:hypothetical protein Poli38472_009837 [Pythium oligandrum]|uniref:Uncharacterized protein n=1 Tax=Pythium oligandrum TaxID=41045 RepID=A0A8K1CG00_PYTOL|nr:hypothetical protein Poli38472_009837 [Pythium oligandrum]|eukprot:TMW62344.1 hypothetical protein Poli38472_009837 [Pythium oligandrum]
MKGERTVSAGNPGRERSERNPLAQLIELWAEILEVNQAVTHYSHRIVELERTIVKQNVRILQLEATEDEMTKTVANQNIRIRHLEAAQQAQHCASTLRPSDGAIVPAGRSSFFALFSRTPSK